MTETEQTMADLAWTKFIEDEGRRVGRRRAGRQHRRGDFMKGVEVGIAQERFRTREYVTPINLRLYDLVKALDDDPNLIHELNALVPETIKKVRALLEGKRT